MNKTELCAAVAAKTGMTRKDAEAAVTAVIDVIGESPEGRREGRDRRLWHV